MEKMLIAFLSLFICFGINDSPVLDGKIEADREYINSVMAPYKAEHQERIAECIQYYSYAYNIPLTIFTQVPAVESGFRYWKHNSKNCVGLYQVSIDTWRLLAWKVVNKRYAKYLNKHDGTNAAEILKYIEANVNAGAIIIDDYRKRYGDYSNVFYRYGGWASKKYRHRTNEMAEYIGKILKDYAE